jgi:hypothetical protein
MTIISAGLDPLIDAFPAPNGIIVVRQGHIQLVSRDGAPLGLLTAAREITAASFDGTELVVADRAMLTAYDTSLTPLGQALIAEPCRDIDAVSSGVVCAPNPGDAPAFWSYGPQPGWARTASTVEHAPIWPLGRLVRVPGRDQVLILDGSSTQDWLMLCDVSASGIVTEIASQPALTEVYRRFVAFDGTQPSRLLADNGAFFRIGPADCATSDPQHCLVLEGSLPPRSTPETLIAAAGDGAGNIQVLRAAAANGPFCGDGCAFDSIDAATGEIRRATTFRLSVSETVSAHYDAVIDGMVFAYRSTDADRVVLLNFFAGSPHTDAGPDPSSGPAPVPPPPDSPRSGCVPNTRLIDSSAQVLTAAPVPGGAIIALDGGPVKMDRNANVLASAPRAMPALSAVFDAGTLAIGDGQGLAFYDQDLQLLREIPVDGGCTTVALLVGGRAVCETPNNTTGFTIMTTFAVDSGDLLATNLLSPFVPKHGTRLRRVPGVDALVSDTWAASTYSLYDVAANGSVSFVNTSLTQSYVPTLPFGFSGSGRSDPLPVHLVAQSGSLLEIFDPDCLTTGGPFHSGCFTPDGEVGSQWGDQQLVAIEDDGQGGLFTIMADFAGNFFSPSARCGSECLLVQHIDLGSRRVISSRMNSLGGVLMIAADAECGMLLVVHSIEGGDPVNPSTTHYRVDLVDYGAP